jgi:hypothetical protein
MAVVECPNCTFRMNAEPGSVLKCTECGFTAEFSAEPAAASSPSTPVESSALAPQPQSWKPTAEQMSKGEPGQWAPLGYLTGVVAFLTFWLAAFVLPFLLGIGAIVMGVMARKREPSDNRALPAIVLGAVAIVAGGVFLLV